MHWGTDLPGTYSDSLKNYSILKGSGIAPLLQGLPSVQFFASGNARTERLTLVDSGTAPISIDSIKIVGPDTSEFHLIATQNLTPFTLFPTHDSPSGVATSSWVDIEFSPDATVRRDRIDTLIALDEDNIHPFAILNGRIGDLSVRTKLHSSLDSLELHLLGNELTILLPPLLETGAKLTIFDELGRRVWTGSANAASGSFDLSMLPDGTYFLRASSGSKVAVSHFVFPR